MNSTGKTIAKNASIMMGAQMVTAIISIGMSVVLPRHLGPANIGALSIAGAIWAIPSVFITWGTDTLLVKEIARAPERAAELCGTALGLRAILYALSWVFVALYITIAHVPTTLLPLVIIAGVTQIIGAAVGVSQTVIQGMELMSYGSIADIVSKAVNLLLVITVLFLGYGVIAVALVGIVTAIVSLTMQQYFLRRQIRTRVQFDPRALRAMIKDGQPYLLSGLALTAYATIDSLIISALVDQRAVGYYSMAQGLTGAFLFIPTIFITAIFPTLSRAHTQDPALLIKLTRKSFDMLLLLAIPVGFGVIAIADPLVVLLYGEAFAPSGPILAVQGITLILIFLTILLGRLLTSSDRQNTWTVVLIIATVITILLDLVLVPWCQHTFDNGAIGGSLSFVITEFAMVIVGIILLPKGTLGFANAFTAARILFAGCVMLLVTWQFRTVFIAIPVLVGSIVYPALILLMRVVPSEDLALLKSMALQAIGRIHRRFVFVKSA